LVTLTEKSKDWKGFKNFCENYLFKDYRLRSGMTIWIFALLTSGRKRGFKGKFATQENFAAFTKHRD